MSQTPTIVLMTIEDVAARLQLKCETIRQMARVGRLPGNKVGKVWRFDSDAIDRWVHGRSNDAVVREPGPAIAYNPTLPLFDSPKLASPPSAFRDPAFTENRAQPIHRWVPWIAGFSSGFVSDCLDQYVNNSSPEDTTILDPFTGVGTTLVEAARRGYGAVGFEVNPYAALAARAKLEAADVSVEQLEFWIQIFRSSMRDAICGDAVPPAAVPPGFRSRIPFFSPLVERQVLIALSFIRGLSDQKLQDLFLIAFGSVMVKFSNYSYEPSLGSRPACGKPLIENADVAAYILAKLEEIARDCREFQRSGCSIKRNELRRVIADSIFNADQYLGPATVDLVITSPPYLNNYHYIRNTRPHLFWLELVADTADLKTIEHASFGKYWQTVRDGDRLDLSFELPELSAAIDCIRNLNTDKGVYGGAGWANYAVQYFNDTYRFCAEMARLMKPGGRAVIVVGNSILQGVELKVDKFLGEIGEQHGLKFEATHMLRKKRVGNSIIRSSVRNVAGIAASLYEVAVVLRKATV